MTSWKRLARIIRASIHRRRPLRETEPIHESPGPVHEEEMSSPSAQDPELAKYYANLEVPFRSDLKTVRSGWRRLLKIYHPDLHSEDPEKRRVANALTFELNKAYREIEKSFGKR